jgi:hypothetical protein
MCISLQIDIRGLTEVEVIVLGISNDEQEANSMNEGCKYGSATPNYFHGGEMRIRVEDAFLPLK